MSTQVKEKYLDGSTRLHDAVLLRNPRAEAVRLVGDDAPIRECGVIPRKLNGQPQWSPLDPGHTGSRRQDVVIGPGETVAVSYEVANDLIQMQCQKTGCKKRWVFNSEPGPARCIDPTHPRKVYGGLAPFLEIVDGPTGAVVAVPLDGNLQPEPRPDPGPDAALDRLMSKAGAK